MKIGIQTWGSLGDIRPFWALADGLQAVGHKVTLVTTRVDSADQENYRSQAGATIIPIASPVIATKKELQEIEQAIFAERDPVCQTQMIIKKLFLPAEEEMYKASEKLCLDNDLVIGHFFHYPLNAAAEKHGRPYVSVSLVHSAIPSAFQPPSGMPNLGAIGNRFSWWLVKSVLNKKLRKYSDQLRLRHGIEIARDLVGNVWASNQLTLVAVSPALCKRSKDWPENYQVCGFLNPRNDALDGEISRELQEFLSADTPPVYMTFGSAMADGHTETISLLREAADKASVRAIIQAPNWEKHGFQSTRRVLFVNSAPHGAVFPRCSAIIHHGGAGTSQSALRAGKPSVVIPHTSEQSFWGRELARIGVAHNPISRNKLTSDQLSTAIKHVIESKDIYHAATKIGIEMAKENGVENAVQLISEKFVA